MTKLPAVNGKQVIAALRKIGFAPVRQRGSHVFIRHPDGRATVVPMHASEDIGPGLLARILNDADLTQADFAKLL